MSFIDYLPPEEKDIVNRAWLNDGESIIYEIGLDKYKIFFIRTGYTADIEAY